MTDLPADVDYGKVVGRFILAVPDGVDPDTLPDEQPMTGTIKFTPRVRVYKNPNPYVAAVLPEKTIVTLDVNGNIVDEQGNEGVWLAVGPYKVTYSLNESKVRTHLIEVKVEHDDVTPLNLRGSIPPIGPIVTSPQYAELAARIDALAELSPVDTVNGQSGTVVLDAEDVGAYSKAEVDAQTAATSGAIASETSARQSGDDALDGRLTALETSFPVDLTDELAAETQARQDADAILDARVLNLESAETNPDLTPQLNAEIQARQDGDSALDVRVTSVEARPVPDVFASDLTAEATARANADSALDARLTTVESAPPGAPDLTDELAAETTARTDADSALGVRLTAVEARPVPDVFASNLMDEETARINADNALDARVDVLEAAPPGAPDLTDELTAETTARIDADSALGARITTLEASSLDGGYLGINAQTGTTYLVLASDVGKLVTLTNASPITVTLQQDSAAAIAVGKRIDFAGLGAGLITFAAGAGATVLATPSLITRAQYSAVSAIKIATNTWLVVGDLT